MWELRLRSRSFISGNMCFEFSILLSLQCDRQPVYRHGTKLCTAKKMWPSFALLAHSQPTFLELRAQRFHFWYVNTLCSAGTWRTYALHSLDQRFDFWYLNTFYLAGSELFWSHVTRHATWPNLFPPIQWPPVFLLSRNLTLSSCQVTDFCIAVTWPDIMHEAVMWPAKCPGANWPYSRAEVVCCSATRPIFSAVTLTTSILLSCDQLSSFCQLPILTFMSSNDHKSVTWPTYKSFI